MELLDLQTVSARILEIEPELKAMDVSELFLFGSVARGENKRTSDVDCLVSFARKFDLFDLSGVQDLLKETLGCHVDLGTRCILRKEIKRNVEEEMVRVF